MENKIDINPSESMTPKNPYTEVPDEPTNYNNVKVSKSPMNFAPPTPARSFGVIVSLRMADFDLPNELVIACFHEAGIDEKFLPNGRMPRKAFKKALQESIQGEEGFMVRPVVKSGHTMSSGLVREQKDANEKNLKYDVCNVLTLNSEHEVIDGKSGFRTESIIESYKDYRGKLGAMEIGLKLKEIFFVSMGINVLCDKCLFIPNKYKPNIDKLVLLFASLRKNGAEATIEVMAVDSDTQTRNTIVSEFTKQTIEQLKKEAEFCYKQRERLETGAVKYLRPTAFKKQMDKMNMLKQRIQTYILVLELTPEEDLPITKALEEVETEIGKNMDLASALAPQRSKKGKRALMEAIKTASGVS